jgi:hypothetical protein
MAARVLPLLLLLITGSAYTLSAQQATALTGRVLAGGQPVTGQPVMLHHVTAAGGSTVSVDTTDTEGRFSLATNGARSPGVSFVGTRYEDKLYIGELIRDVLPSDYVVRVGPGATPVEFGPAAPTPPAVAAQSRPQPRPPGIAAIVIGLLGVGTLLWIASAGARRTPESRRLLIEVAELDNRHEATEIPAYAQRRAELLRRLRESA